MKSRCIVLIVLFFLPALCFAQSFTDMVDQYLSIVQNKHDPSVSDCTFLEGLESELELELLLCAQQGMIPQTESKDCHDFIKSRANNEDHTKSITLAWIKTKLPTEAPFEIEHVDTLDWGFKIHVIMDKTTLVFVRVADPQLFVPLGWLSLESVNGTRVRDLLKQDIDAGLQLSTFVNN